MANNYRKDVPTSTDFGLTANWGSALAAAQTLVLAYDVPGGITTNLGYGGTDFAGLVLANDKRIPLGANGTPLEVTVNQTSTGVIKDQSYGDKYLSAGATTNVWWRAEFSPSRQTTLGLTNAKVYTLYLGPNLRATMSDTLVIDATTGWLIITGGDHVLEYRSGSVPARITVVGNARVKLKRPWSELEIGGTAVVTVELDDAAAAGGTVRMFGGTLKPVKGDMGKVYALAGTLDKSALVKVVTVDTLYTSEILKIVPDAGDLKVTMTNGTVPYGRDALTTR